MTGNAVNGSGNGVRSGAQTLTLLATPPCILILRSLAAGSRQQTELRRNAGGPPQTTLRTQLKQLAKLGAIEKHRRNRFPGVLEYELTAVGRELLQVAEVLERWLEGAPAGRLVLGESAAKTVTKALTEGWSTMMLRAFAAAPLSLTELDGVIGSLSYPALERRLGAMRLAGLVEPRPGNGRGTPYVATGWLRRGMAPVISAAWWERHQRPTLAPPIGSLEIETAFLLAVPPVRLIPEQAGTCRIAAEVGNGKPRFAGVTVDIEAGSVTHCSTKLNGSPGAWALGSVAAWMQATIHHDLAGLELGGDSQLARALVDALHAHLFKANSPANKIHP